MASFIPYAFAFLLAVNAAYGLRCYKCNSQDNVSCKWGITSFTYDSEDCASVGILDGLIGAKCFKITGEAKDGAEVIARGCLPPATVGCGAIASAIGWISSQTNDDPHSLKNLNCVTCETDKCNSAQRLTGVTFIGLILAATIFAF